MNPAVTKTIAVYPKSASLALKKIRQLIFSVAREHDLSEIEETLKWGQPAYLVKQGSTIRIAWRDSDADKLRVYFNCQSKLVETFRELYATDLYFEGNRAIVVDLPIRPDKQLLELEHCLTLALNYHRLKHLPMLGAFGSDK